MEQRSKGGEGKSLADIGAKRWEQGEERLER